MFAIFKELSELELAFISLITLALLFVGYKIGGFMSAARYRKMLKNQEQESHVSSKNLKKLMDDEKEALTSENVALKSGNDSLSKKLEEYRRKISGMGMLSFGGSKKRSDILYSLLLENEALENLLMEQGDKLADERKDFVKHRLKDIGKRQRLIAEIFNDDTIKNYVEDVLSDNDRIKAAFDKVDKVDEIDDEDENKKLD